MAVTPLPKTLSAAPPPQPPAVFYGPLDPGNPVVDSFKGDLHDGLSFLQRKQGTGGAKEQELHRRGATALFHIWNKYKPLFPDWYYNEKLVKIGDQLMEMKEYKLALLQCYGQYLQQICKVDVDMLGLNVQQFQSHFFPNGFRDKTASRTFHVLQARNTCIYRMVCDNDMDLLNQESLGTCFKLLSTLQLIMQMTLPHENLCWIVYNGTIHMYTICRHLMTVGQSAKVHEYLLWACICMESSVPLLAVHYLPWRATLYAAVCQCYYDCQVGMHGEVFARRALIKIDELKQMENMSSPPLSAETKKIFKEAGVKMAAMIFKRAIFEPRRRPKGIFRQRMKANLKEAQHLPWPRTISERLLLEMFDCNSSQFFAILEALFDRNRRTLIPSPPVPDEMEIRDVISELFFAGTDILDGGGGSTQGSSPTEMSGVILATSTLMQQILAGKNCVSGDSALRFLKMAFSYEEWDTFDRVAELFYAFLKSQKCPVWMKAEIELKILLAMQPLVCSRKPKHFLCIQENNIREISATRTPGKKSIAFQERTIQVVKTTDDLFLLALTLYYCTCTTKEILLPDREMVIDAIMFLWQKCKVGIQRIQASGSNFLKFPKKYQTLKWINILYIVIEVIFAINLGDVNAVVMAETVLRLTAVLENIAEFTIKSGPQTEKNEALSASEFCIDGMASLIQQTPAEQFFLAYQYLDRAISAMNQARLLTVLPDGASVLDHCCKKQLNRPPASDANEKPIAGHNFIMDLHLELIQAQHRVAVKLLRFEQGTQTDDRNTRCKSPVKNIKQPKYLTESDILMKIKKNKLSKALYLMQKATLMFPGGLGNASPNQLLEEAFSLIQKAKAQHNVMSATFQQSESNAKSKVPPPPILLSRSHCSMSFKPSPFVTDEKVSWYCIFGCIAEGSNRKVRLNNYDLKNSAEVIPANETCILEVEGLETNEMYMFAVAAYSSNGKLIGGSIGETTKPILAYPPLSVATVRAYLIQSAFQLENYTLSKKAFQPLWDYFVSVPQTPVADVTFVSASSSVTLPKNRLILEAVSQTSPNLLYLFIRSIFMINDINVQDGALFCDSVCFNELRYNRQIARLAECGRMLVAIELSNWLNDVQYSLQAVVLCYGLIAPLIYHTIPSDPLIQITIKCLTVLYEIPNSVMQRKATACFESIQHMIACSCFFTAKVLRSWREYELAIVIINYGKKLLDCSQSGSPMPAGEEGVDEIIEAEMHSKRLKSIVASEKVNENLEALETNLLKLVKPGPDLTGEEDTLFLFPVVSNWQTRIAYKEVLKFKKSPRFLEYFVRLMYKTLNEERFHRIIDWADEVQEFVKKRNRYLLGIRRKQKKKRVYQKKNLGLSLPKAVKKKPRKRGLYKLGKGYDPQRREREEARRLAIQSLVQKLNLRCNVFLKRRRFRHVIVEEMPWRAQMNIYLGIAHFNMFKKQVEDLCNIDVNYLPSLNSYDELDPDMFSLNKSGTIVVLTTKEAKMKMCNLPLFRRTPSGKIKRKADGETFEPSTKMNERESPRAHAAPDRGHVPLKERERAICYAAAQEHFTKTFLHFRRAVVVAHRGGHWTLLQNACRDLWNYTQEARVLIKQLESFYTPFPITREIFLNNVWRSYYMASDALVDMIIDLQTSNSVKIIEDEGDFCVPSCIGGIADENGGSNLYFEYPFDDVTVVDLRGVCNLVLQTLEILFHLKKWDPLAYIALQFNTVTHERYTEQVTPLLVFAQRQIQERLQSCDSNIPQFLFKDLVTTTGKKVSSRDFVAKKVHSAIKCYSRSEELHGIPEGNKASFRVSIPVDVRDTLKYFRESFEKSRQHNTALRYSRKLLALLLANTQEYSNSRESNRKGPFQIGSHGRVGFIMGAELTYQPEPPDLSEENFAFLSMIQSNSIPQSKLSIVIASYEKTLESLQTFNQQGPRVQAFHELGNLHFYAGNKRAAFKCWCQGLDGALNKADALHHWQELGGLSESATGNLASYTQGYCEKFISQAGIWGCLLGAVLAAKIAQYMLLYDVQFRTKTCILSALLFKSLFRATLPHPTADCDFAQYETEILIPGIDIFLDYYRADIATVVASLNFVMYELHVNKQNLIVLPLFTLYQYFVSEVCRDAIKCIEGRILKVKVLTDLGFFSEAFNEICTINYGDKIPWKLPSLYRLNSRPPASAKFETSEPILANANLQVLEDILNRPLHLFWSSMCDPRIMNNFMLAKMHLILCIAATLNCIPERVLKTIYCTESDIIRKGGKAADAVMKGFVLPTIVVAGKREPNVMIVELEKNKDILNMAMIKGILLAEAEERISSVLESIQVKYGLLMNECSASELETMIEAKLQLAAIAQQRLQTTFSAALVISAIKLIQAANVFKTPDFPQAKVRRDEVTEECVYIEDSNLHHNVAARERMNIHLWLRCRLALVIAVTAQARGIETMKENELAECASLISEVQREAEAFNAVETLAEITIQAVMLGMQERQPVADIKHRLQTIIILLEEKTVVSPPACLTLVQSMLLLSDIMRIHAEDSPEHPTSEMDQLNLLILAHRLVIEQLFMLGQLIEQHAENPTFTVPRVPFKNIYLPHLKLLAKVKMRIGHALTLKLSCTSGKQNELQWLQALKHTETALELCTTSIKREFDLEAELLFRKGKIERQINIKRGDKSILPIESFWDAIHLSLQSYQNYGMIRRSYLEIALLYFYLITNKDESLSSSTSMGRTCKLKAGNTEELDPEEITPQDMNRVQVWIAVRAAAQVSEAFLASQQLIGKKAVKLYHIRERIQRDIPEFAHLDLSSSYKDFLSDGFDVCYKAPTIPTAQDDKSESDESESVSSEEGQGKPKLSWVHIIRYNTYLTRLLNMCPLLAVPKAGAGLFAKEDALFTSVFDTSTALRLAAMHTFLKTYLPVYPGSSLQEPPKELYDFEKPCFSESVLQKPTLETLAGSIMSTESSFSTIYSSETNIQIENKTTSTPIRELCVQWYLPSLEQLSEGEHTMVLFIYAYNTKPVQINNLKYFNSANINCGYLWIPLKSVIAVREKLSELRQHIEILMQSSTVAQTQSETRRSFLLSRSQLQTAKVMLDDKTKKMVKQCFSEIRIMLSVDRKQSSPQTEIPFDITLPSIKNLQKLFDPATGCVITAGNVFNWMVSLLQ